MEKETIERLLSELTQRNKKFVKLCMVVAEKRRRYNEIYTGKILEVQKLGTHISLIKDLARGSKSVGDAKHEIVIAEMKMKECSDLIKEIQTRMQLEGII